MQSTEWHEHPSLYKEGYHSFDRLEKVKISIVYHLFQIVRLRLCITHMILHTLLLIAEIIDSVDGVLC